MVARTLGGFGFLRAGHADRQDLGEQEPADGPQRPTVPLPEPHPGVPQHQPHRRPPQPHHTVGRRGPRPHRAELPVAALDAEPLPVPIRIDTGRPPATRRTATSGCSAARSSGASRSGTPPPRPPAPTSRGPRACTDTGPPPGHTPHATRPPSPPAGASAPGSPPGSRTAGSGTGAAAPPRSRRAPGPAAPSELSPRPDHRIPQPGRDGRERLLPDGRPPEGVPARSADDARGRVRVGRVDAGRRLGPGGVTNSGARCGPRPGSSGSRSRVPAGGPQPSAPQGSHPRAAAGVTLTGSASGRPSCGASTRTRTSGGGAWPTSRGGPTRATGRYWW